MTRQQTRRMHKLRDEFFELGKKQFARGERDAAKCWLCGGEIDYTAKPATTPDSHTLDHLHAVDDRPDLQEDVDNFRHAHYSCNSSRGKRTPNTQGLGEQVAAWW
jgi:5-methylcytosine-specific restriction endonuclease McrA